LISLLAGNIKMLCVNKPINQLTNNQLTNNQSTN